VAEYCNELEEIEILFLISMKEETKLFASKRCSHFGHSTRSRGTI